MQPVVWIAFKETEIEFEFDIAKVLLGNLRYIAKYILALFIDALRTEYE